MKSFAILPVVGLFATAQATYYNETAWTTVTVETLTTFCPEATTITTGGNTYTATASETLTITDCPCTVSHPVKPTYAPHPPKGNETHPPVYVTTTVSEYTTYCPYPTEFPVGPNSTITVTEPTTLTISDCPCTLTKPGVVTTTVSYITTYCPEPTTLTIPGPEGPKTYPVTAPGTVTIPVDHQTTVPAPEPTGPAYTAPPAPPAATTTAVQIPGTGAPPQPTTTGPLEANSAIKRDAGFGAVFAVGVAAMFL